MNQRERMLSGLPYKAWLDGLEEDRQACKQKIYDFNQLPPSRQSKEAPQMIKNIFGIGSKNTLFFLYKIHKKSSNPNSFHTTYLACFTLFLSTK